MKYRYYLLLLTLILCDAKKIFSQNAENKIKELKVGDQCPDFEFKDLVNYKSSTARLSDFKEKLVILDFWATWCGPCINVFPKLNFLQTKFKEKLMVISVTSETKELVKNFFKSKQNFTNFNIPSVTSDSNLIGYFPHTLIPHTVWIDGAGKVVAITSGENVNDEALTSYFKDSRAPSNIKKDMEQNFDKPLLMGGLGDYFNFHHNLLRYYSVLRLR